MNSWKTRILGHLKISRESNQTIPSGYVQIEFAISSCSHSKLSSMIRANMSTFKKEKHDVKFPNFIFFQKFIKKRSLHPMPLSKNADLSESQWDFDRHAHWKASSERILSLYVTVQHVSTHCEMATTVYKSSFVILDFPNKLKERMLLNSPEKGITLPPRFVKNHFHINRKQFTTDSKIHAQNDCGNSRLAVFL